MSINVLDFNLFQNLYISKKYIFYEHARDCCGCDVTVKFSLLTDQPSYCHGLKKRKIENTETDITRVITLLTLGLTSAFTFRRTTNGS